MLSYLPPLPLNPCVHLHANLSLHLPLSLHLSLHPPLPDPSPASSAPAAIQQRASSRRRRRYLRKTAKIWIRPAPLVPSGHLHEELTYLLMRPWLCLLISSLGERSLTTNC